MAVATTTTTTGPLFHCADGFLSWFLAWLVNNSTAKLATQSAQTEDIVCMRRRCREGAEEVQRRCGGDGDSTRRDELSDDCRLWETDAAASAVALGVCVRVRIVLGAVGKASSFIGCACIYIDVYSPRQYVCIYYVHKYFACVFLEFN